MEPGFFSSREFVVSAIVALAAVGVGAAFALDGDVLGFGGHSYSRDACDEPDLPGADLEGATHRSEEVDGGRVVRYAFDPADRQGGAIAGCAVFGDVAVGASPDGLVHVAFTIHAEGSRARELLDATVVRAVFRDAGAGLAVLAWIEEEGAFSGVGSSRTTLTDVEVLVPATGAYDVRLDTSFGLASVDGIMTREAVLESDLGDVRVSGVDAQGDLTADTSHGDIEVSLAGVRNGTLRLTSNLGDLILTLPQRADVGYDVTAASDLGEVDVSVGPAETYDSQGEGMGERVHVRTVGYADKPAQVVVLSESNHGDVTVTVGAA